VPVRFSAYNALESYSYAALFTGVIDPTRTGVAYGTVFVTGAGAELPGLFAPLPPPPPAQATNCRTTIAKSKIRFIK
jgi:hypothetical protein